MKDTDPDRNCSFFNEQQNCEYNINDFNTMSKPDMFYIVQVVQVVVRVEVSL